MRRENRRQAKFCDAAETNIMLKSNEKGQACMHYLKTNQNVYQNIYSNKINESFFKGRIINYNFG